MNDIQKAYYKPEPTATPAQAHSPLPDELPQWQIDGHIRNHERMAKMAAEAIEYHPKLILRIGELEAHAQRLADALRQCCQLMDIHEIEIPGFVLRDLSQWEKDKQ